MRIKSNTVLSDAELRRISQILRVSDTPEQSLQLAFPSIKITMAENIIYMGAPPWDLTQEIPL